MWVCLCKGVTDRQIRAAVDCGARTTVEIGAACRAGTKCGGCLPEVARLVSDHLSSAACFDCPERQRVSVRHLQEEAVPV